MGGFFDFEKMEKALDAECPQGAKLEDINVFCQKHCILGQVKLEFLSYLVEKLGLPSDAFDDAISRFRPISLTPFLDGK